MVNFFKNLKAPYTFAVVGLSTAVALLLVVWPGLGVDEAAYKFSALLVGAFLIQAGMAVAVRALPTMLWMVVCALLLIVMNIFFTHAEVFKNSAVEGLLLGAGGALAVLIKGLLERHQIDNGT